MGGLHDFQDKRRAAVEPGPAGRYEWKASDVPGIRPGMLLPRIGVRGSVFPFSARGIGYYYYARNGIFALCRHWRLEGREVLFPSYFHGVELEALLAAGVRPKFYPVNAEMQIDIDALTARITPETQAVYMIHYLGFPGPVEALREICRERKLKLIEDCALALLSKKGSRPLGSFGDAAVFCLYKSLPLPTGGALVLGSKESASFATRRAPWRAAWSNLGSSLVQHFERRGNRLAQSALNGTRLVMKTAARLTGTEWVGVGGQHFEIDRAHLGMNSLNHVLVAGQNYRQIVKTRRRNYLFLLRHLSPLSRPVFADLPKGVCPLFYPLRAPFEKQEFIDRLHARRVMAVNFWLQGHPSVTPEAFPESDRLRRTILEIPCHQDLDESDMLRITDIVKEEWGRMLQNCCMRGSGPGVPVHDEPLLHMTDKTQGR